MSLATLRLLAAILIAAVFVLSTLLAHRTHPAAHKQKTVGLAIGAFVIGVAWLLADGTLDLSSIVLLAILSPVFAVSIMKTTSGLRWLAPAVTLAFLVFSLITDVTLDTELGNVAIALTLSMLYATFVGHLLRARYFRSLLYADQKHQRQALLEEAKTAALRADERAALAQDLLAMPEEALSQDARDKLALIVEAKLAQEDFSRALATLFARFEPRLAQAAIHLELQTTQLIGSVPVKEIEPLLTIAQNALQAVLAKAQPQTLCCDAALHGNTMVIVFKDSHGVLAAPEFAKIAYHFGADSVEINPTDTYDQITIRFRFSLRAEEL